MIIIGRYTTLGTPVPDPDYPSLNCGYDDCRDHLVIIPEDRLADWYDPETVHKFKTLAEVETIGL